MDVSRVSSPNLTSVGVVPRNGAIVAGWSAGRYLHDPVDQIASLRKFVGSNRNQSEVARTSQEHKPAAMEYVGPSGPERGPVKAVTPPMWESLPGSTIPNPGVCAQVMLSAYYWLGQSKR